MLKINIFSQKTDRKNLKFLMHGFACRKNYIVLSSTYYFIISCMLTLESQCILVVLGGVLVSRTMPNCYRINKELLTDPQQYVLIQISCVIFTQLFLLAQQTYSHKSYTQFHTQFFQPSRLIHINPILSSSITIQA